MSDLALVRRMLLWMFGEYDLWRIYSIDTAACREPDPSINVKPIEDLGIFELPDLEPELRRANWSRPDAFGYAVWSNDTLAAVCWLWSGPLLEGRNIGRQPTDCAELIQITVASKFRGLGLAPALIMHAGCRLRDLGYRRLYAQIWRSNVSSAKAFAKAGWDHVAWFIQFHPPILSHPLRFRTIRSDFRSRTGLLENWRRASHLPADTQETAITIDWKPGPQSLKFTASDITLGQFRFGALVCEAPITSFGSMQRPPLPPLDLFTSSLTAAVIRTFPLSKDLPTFQLHRRWLRYVPIKYSRLLIKRDGSFEDYLGKFAAKSRKNLRRSVSKVEKANGSSDSWREYKTVADVAEFHRFAAAISSQTYQSRLFQEGVDLDANTRTHLDALAANDRFRGYLLFLDGQPAAFALCEAMGRVLLYKNVGYIPQYREYSPGTVLLWHIIERLFAERCFDYLDFGEGEGFYKVFFSNLSLRCARVYYFRLRPTIIVCVLAHRLWNLTLSIGHRFPGASALINRFRRAWRGHVVGPKLRWPCRTSCE